MNNMMLNQNWMMKHEDNNEKDSDNDLNQNKEGKLPPDYGQIEMTNLNHHDNHNAFRSPQNLQYPGYNDIKTEKPYYLQQPKIPYSGLNFPYSEETPQDFYKSEMKISENKYIQDYQKFNQPQEKLDVNAKEYVPNSNLLN